MNATTHRWTGAAGWALGLAIGAAGLPVLSQKLAQDTVPPTFSSQSGKGVAATAGVEGQPVTLDSVVAIVNGDLVLSSDVEAERRFAAFQPFGAPKTMTQEELVNRLIDRALILQQMVLERGRPVTDAQVDTELNALRKSVPRCAAYHCVTDAGWQKFVADQGFTMAELQERWKQRMQVLEFVEERFRMGIRVLPSEIDEYYKTTMIPAYVKENAQVPQETTIADRIQEILLQQRVDKLLDDWLTALRAEGGVRILKPGEVAP